MSIKLETISKLLTNNHQIGADKQVAINIVQKIINDYEITKKDLFAEEADRYTPLLFGQLTILLPDETPANGVYLGVVRRPSVRVDPIRYALGNIQMDIVDTKPILKTDTFAICRRVNS